MNSREELRKNFNHFSCKFNFFTVAIIKWLVVHQISSTRLFTHSSTLFTLKVKQWIRSGNNFLIHIFWVNPLTSHFNIESPTIAGVKKNFSRHFLRIKICRFFKVSFFWIKIIFQQIYSIRKRKKKVKIVWNVIIFSTDK